MNISERIYKAAGNIPRGKVITYKILGQLAGVKNPRVVGNILHKNPDPQNIPCHRVVNGRGELAEHFAFGGIKGQTQRLKKDGITVNQGKVDLARYLWRT